MVRGLHIPDAVFIIHYQGMKWKPNKLCYMCTITYSTKVLSQWLQGLPRFTTIFLHVQSILCKKTFFTWRLRTLFIILCDHMEHKPSITLYSEWICGLEVVRLLITCVVSSCIYAYEIHAAMKPAARAASLNYVVVVLRQGLIQTSRQQMKRHIFESAAIRLQGSSKLGARVN